MADVDPALVAPDLSADFRGELSGARSILCVQPHYDDNDIGAGGTFAALAAAGVAVHYLTVADDLKGVLDATLSDEEATAELEREQLEAARHIGVRSQRWLRLPDAGDWDVVLLRTRIIEEIRRLEPDYVFTCDPWLANEAHRDHTRTGSCVAEAVLFHQMPRFRTLPEVDAAYYERAAARLPGERHEVAGLVLYFTREPNLVFDIDRTRERKHWALDAYRAQFTTDGLASLHRAIEAMERRWAHEEDFRHGEALRLLRPHQLHVGLV